MRLLLLFTLFSLTTGSIKESDGVELYRKAHKEVRRKNFELAKDLFKKFLETDSLMEVEDSPDVIPNRIIEAFRSQGAVEYGYMIIAHIYHIVGAIDKSREFAQLAVQANSRFAEPYVYLAETLEHDPDLYQKYFRLEPFLSKALEHGGHDPKVKLKKYAVNSC
jgi:hypothetical protein